MKLVSLLPFTKIMDSDNSDFEHDMCSDEDEEDGSRTPPHIRKAAQFATGWSQKNRKTDTLQPMKLFEIGKNIKIRILFQKT